MRLLGFDFDAGRLDVSTHPFCGGVPEDVRMTTRFREDEFLRSLMGTIHETGHGRYEQNLPRELLGQPVARSALDGDPREPVPDLRDAAGQPSGLRRACWRRCSPGTSGRSRRSSAANLQRLITRVKPGLIRVDADEVSYPAHIILRYEIERRLIEGEIEAEDIPALWDEGWWSCWASTRAATSRTAACRTCTGRAACSATSRVIRSARCTPRSGSRRCAARTPDLDARIAAWRLRAGVRLAARQHLAAGQPLDHRRAGACAPAARR